ncbi:hypothetical protein [Marinimicrobium sp. ABcell2]|uniref:hypothetical protein n=1 Tax=Marinimicrobium sp. ABcell2 TaxID=3069751 RepID=UPI0027B81A09|nr:hypothetical protein [Marinimicrobium sp. ABcell2]MDQ2076075.1 hypothetical protein [Marinimicrobium sp. ABcell2]
MSTHDKEDGMSNPGGRSWRMIGVLAGAALVGVLGFYWFSFRNHPRSSNPEMWAAFGDYMGGVLGPVLGLLTIILLVQTLRQTDASLAQSREALKQSREELELTRAELLKGQQIQRMTEEALSKQIVLAQRRNDFDSATTLIRYYQERIPELNERIEQGRMGRPYGAGLSDVDLKDRVKERNKMLEDRRDLLTIIQKESARLVKTYCDQ